MDVERIERIADLVRNTRGEQGQRLDAFALDGFVSFLARFGYVVQN